MPITRTDRDELDGQVVRTRQVDITTEVVEWDLHDQADKSLAGLRAITDSTGSLTVAQLSNAVRVMARVLIVLVRLMIRRLDDVT